MRDEHLLQLRSLPEKKGIPLKILRNSGFLPDTKLIMQETLVIPPFYQKYVDLLSDEDILIQLEKNMYKVLQILSGIKDSRGSFRYADGKWTIREVIGHMIDAERIFFYRMLCISRGEKKSLPGFEENDYVSASN
jgi:hypothetical protein